MKDKKGWVEWIWEVVLLTGGMTLVSFCLGCCWLSLNNFIMVNVHNPHHLFPQSKDTHRGQGKQRSACLYFALPSEQAVNLCSAPAYLGACHPRPCPGRKASHASALSPPPSPRLTLYSVLLGWVEEVAADWIILPFTISPKFAFICRALSLLFSCVCFLSGSRSESVSTCCIISNQL